MQRLPIKQRVAKVVPFLQRARLVADPPPCDTAPYVTRILEAAGDRVKVAGDILDYDDFFVADDQLAVRRGGAREAAAQAGRRARAAAEVSRRAGDGRAVHRRAARTTDCTRSSQPQGIKIGDIVHAVRVAVTGKAGRLRPVRHAGHPRPRAVSGRIDRALTLGLIALGIRRTGHFEWPVSPPDLLAISSSRG